MKQKLGSILNKQKKTYLKTKPVSSCKFYNSLVSSVNILFQKRSQRGECDDLQIPHARPITTSRRVTPLSTPASSLTHHTPLSLLPSEPLAAGLYVRHHIRRQLVVYVSTYRQNTNNIARRTLPWRRVKWSEFIYMYCIRIFRIIVMVLTLLCKLWQDRLVYWIW